MKNQKEIQVMKESNKMKNKKKRELMKIIVQNKQEIIPNLKSSRMKTTQRVIHKNLLMIRIKEQNKQMVLMKKVLITQVRQINKRVRD